MTVVEEIKERVDDIIGAYNCGFEPVNRREVEQADTAEKLIRAALTMSIAEMYDRNSGKKQRRKRA